MQSRRCSPFDQSTGHYPFVRIVEDGGRSYQHADYFVDQTANEMAFRRDICIECEQEFIEYGLSITQSKSIEKLLEHLKSVNQSHGRGLRPDVFISYSALDEEFARKIATDIHQRGHKVWFAKFEMGPGDSLFDKIDKAILESQLMIVVLSPPLHKFNVVSERVASRVQP